MSSLMARVSMPAVRRVVANQCRRACGGPGTPAACHGGGDGAGHAVAEHVAVGSGLVAGVGGEPPAGLGHGPGQVDQHGVQGDGAAFVALADDGDGAFGQSAGALPQLPGGNEVGHRFRFGEDFRGGALLLHKHLMPCQNYRSETYWGVTGTVACWRVRALDQKVGGSNPSGRPLFGRDSCSAPTYSKPLPSSSSQ